MDDWPTLMRKRYSPESAWEAFCAWDTATGPKTRVPKYRQRELQNELLVSVVPLIGALFRKRFSSFQLADQEDACTEVSWRLIRRFDRHRRKFRMTGEPPAFTALLTVTLRNLFTDWFRCNFKERELPADFLYRKPVLSVPKAVDVKLLLEELPDNITNFALERDRFGFGVVPIRAVVRLLVAGKDIPHDMLRNWLQVENPERCVAFCALMTRWWLYKYRDKFEPVLEFDLRDRVFAVDQNCHIL